MRAHVAVLALLVCSVLAAGISVAGELAALKSATLVKAFTSKDFPAPEPGKDVWAPANADKWAYDIVVEGKWVYAVSAPARNVVRFERDPSTASLEFKEAIPIESKDKESGGATLHVRHAPGGGALLYVFFSTHHETSLLCYALDDKTGTLTLKGKGDLSIFPNADVGAGYGYPVSVWSPDQNRLYYVGVKKAVWYTFKEDGVPVMEGKGIVCTNPGKEGRGRGHAVLSLDGRRLYILTEKMVPAGTTFWQVDTYDCDSRTGDLTYSSALDLPNLPRECAELLGFTPDGKLLYVIDERAVCYCALGCDVEKGTLSVLSSGKPDPSMNGTGGPPWARGGKFAFNADGKSGYYLGSRAFGSFINDPASGALSGLTSIGGMWAKLALDPLNGNLFLVGGQSISAFKTPAGR